MVTVTAVAQMTMMTTESRAAVPCILHSCHSVVATILCSWGLHSYRYANCSWGGDSLHLRYPSQEDGRDHTLEVAAERDVCGAGLCCPWGLTLGLRSRPSHQPIF